MNSEILINVTPMETRVAIVENGAVQELFVERAQSRGIVANIYQGKVIRVLPGMQAAFVDIGLEKAAFIHVADILDKGAQNGEEAKPIGYLLREGQIIVVQVTKDPLGTKGARLTMHLSIASRFLVFLPYSKHIGISQRIDTDEERERLKNIVQAGRDSEKVEFGYILRTAAEGITQEESLNDIQYSKRLWRVLKERMASPDAPSLIYEDLPLSLRVCRDMMRPEVDKIRIDSKETFQKVTEFVEKYTPSVMSKLEYYPGERPIFDLFSVEDEIQKALARKVDLKSGGYLIIDQTEAMTTVDVNTGGFVGHRNLEETIYKTNLEAATSLVRQLRLRNLGGIIIIDFIDMIDEEHQRQVMRVLEKNLVKDHVKSKLTEVSQLGLVEMTRKRTRESLEHILTDTCNTCDGRGRIKTAQTICYEIFREILREERAYNSSSYRVLASQSVVDRLLDEESANVADLEEFINKPITLQVETLYSQEQFDVVML
ncbi:MAG: ribonuclease G [Saccharospirillaceae bacterium]|nr:ribonuclease G [Pseudomonadales bacterium]NRB79851.1 ribonuclease G [Saccharospirillaceae bacterium]